jgi:hypothetical protein
MWLARADDQGGTVHPHPLPAFLSPTTIRPGKLAGAGLEFGWNLDAGHSGLFTTRYPPSLLPTLFLPFQCSFDDIILLFHSYCGRLTRCCCPLAS